MENKISIAIDLDDVLTNFVDSWLNHYNFKSGDHLTKDKITDWNISKFVQLKWRKGIYELLKEDIVYEKALLREECIPVIKWFLTLADVYIITAYNYKICEAKGKWIEKHLPFFPIKNLIFSNDKSIFNIDYLIDDRFENVRDFNGCGILFQDDTPWNYNITDHYPIVHNWGEVQTFFENELIQLGETP